MSWEVSNLIINDDTGVTIKGSRGTLSNVNPSTIFNVYLSDAQSRTRMNPNANTILCGPGNSSNGYTEVFGFTLPTDKTIYIQTDQNDGNVWFWWDGLTQGSDFGTNYGYFRGIFIEQSYTYGFNFQDTAYNLTSSFNSKTINEKIYRGQAALGFSEQFLPLIWTTIPLSNFVINGERYDSNKSGGAGSGYIGNSLLSSKKMVGYNVPTSSAESTKTESVNEASETPVSGKPKIGNGFARIKFLKNVHQYSFDDILKNTDLTHLKQSTNAYPMSRAGYIPDSLLQYVGTDWILNCSTLSGIATLERNNSEYVWTSDVNSDSFDFFPIKQEYIGKDLIKIKMKVMLTSTQSQTNDAAGRWGLHDSSINDVTNVLYFDYNWDISHHNIDSLNTWYEIEVDLRGKTMTDYLRLYCQSGVWKFKDISIYMVSD